MQHPQISTRHLKHSASKSAVNYSSDIVKSNSFSNRNQIADSNLPILLHLTYDDQPSTPTTLFHLNGATLKEHSQFLGPLVDKAEILDGDSEKLISLKSTEIGNAEKMCGALAPDKLLVYFSLLEHLQVFVKLGHSQRELAHMKAVHQERLAKLKEQFSSRENALKERLRNQFRMQIEAIYQKVPMDQIVVQQHIINQISQSHSVHEAQQLEMLKAEEHATLETVQQAQREEELPLAEGVATVSRMALALGFSPQSALSYALLALAFQSPTLCTALVHIISSNFHLYAHSPEWTSPIAQSARLLDAVIADLPASLRPFAREAVLPPRANPPAASEDGEGASDAPASGGRARTDRSHKVQPSPPTTASTTHPPTAASSPPPPQKEGGDGSEAAQEHRLQYEPLGATLPVQPTATKVEQLQQQLLYALTVAQHQAENVFLLSDTRAARNIAAAKDDGAFSSIVLLESALQEAQDCIVGQTVGATPTLMEMENAVAEAVQTARALASSREHTRTQPYSCPGSAQSFAPQQPGRVTAQF